jgi:hypothetical protein
MHVLAPGVAQAPVPLPSQLAVSTNAHPMITRTRDGTRRSKEYTDGTIRYDPHVRLSSRRPLHIAMHFVSLLSVMP